VVDQVREMVRLGAMAVMGNHDQAVVRGEAPGMRPDARHVVEWTRAQLDASQLDWLASLPMTQRHGDQFYVHANAWSPSGWEYIQGRSEAVRSLHATDCRYTFCGHMHEPKLFHVSSTGKAGDFVPTAGVAIPVPPHRQWLVIPGSAGQPRDGNPAACYAMFDDDQSLLTYHRVPYDHQSAGAKILAAKLPQRLASRLEDGQ
jgi:diadenosine tetraphosphatase ApaH/serine/threonine PP2A family protein phosphatase